MEKYSGQNGSLLGRCCCCCCNLHLGRARRRAATSRAFIARTRDKTYARFRVFACILHSFFAILFRLHYTSIRLIASAGALTEQRTQLVPWHAPFICLPIVIPIRFRLPRTPPSSPLRSPRLIRIDSGGEQHTRGIRRNGRGRLADSPSGSAPEARIRGSGSVNVAPSA